MSALEVSLGIAIPDTVQELQAIWDASHTVELVGTEHRPRFWGLMSEKHHGTVLTTWTVNLNQLPAVLEWHVDVESEPKGARLEDGRIVEIYPRQIHLYPGDTLMITFTP